MKDIFRVFFLLSVCPTVIITLPGQTFTSLFSFQGSNGRFPNAAPVQGMDGNFYGTSQIGGITKQSQGTVYKVTPGGSLTTLYTFCLHGRCIEGIGPWYTLVQVPNGDFYGTTSNGGAVPNGGTLFKITAAGQFTLIHSFCNGCLIDGQSPSALTLAANGDIYGMTEFGGQHGDGTIFKLTPDGQVTQLYSFCFQTNCADGMVPASGLIQVANGDFYGATAGTVFTTCPTGSPCGTIFKFTPSGTLSTLYTFCSQSNCTDGASPEGPLVHAGNGDFYGVTFSGGANNMGTVFRMTPTGQLTTLHSFCAQANCADGYYPTGGLVQGSDGNFYGTTSYGGRLGDGTVFRITPGGKLTTLHTFDKTTGASPVGMVQATDGVFYGTTSMGGSSDLGTLFSLSLGLAPFVESLPSVGTVGETTNILGTNLAGVMSVNFNGTATPFNLMSSSLITAVVPPGASSGKVDVVTLGGTLSSKVPFQVIP